MVEVSVESVRINLATSQRVVILKDAQTDRYLFIWIANPEAYSIAMELQGTSSPRPLTHDLLKTVITELGGTLSNVIISDLIDDIFYARLVLDANGRHVEIDSRPSDAIALAVRLKAPIYVSESVMEQAGLRTSMLCFSPDFTHPDPAERGRQVERQKAAIDLSIAIGTR